MQFSEIFRRAIELGDRITNSPKGASRDAKALAKKFLSDLSVAQVFMLTTLMYLGRGDFGTAGLLNSYEEMSDTFNRPELAINQMLEKPFGLYLLKAELELKKAGIALDSILGSFGDSPLATVDYGSDAQLSIGPCVLPQLKLECRAG